MFFIDVIITFFLAHNSLQLSLRGSVMEMLVMSMYWSMLSSTALVCIVDLTSIVDLICVCWNVTYAEDCRSVISSQEPLPHSLWISLDLHGILAIVWTPAYAVVYICVLAT